MTHLKIFLIVAFSSRNPLCNEIIIKINIIVNGKAETIAADCNPFKPPDQRRTMAAADCTNPQIALIGSGGLSIPFVVCIPITNVVESAEVIKNVPINIIDTTIVMVLNGN